MKKQKNTLNKRNSLLCIHSPHIYYILNTVRINLKVINGMALTLKVHSLTGKLWTSR